MRDKHEKKEMLSNARKEELYSIEINKKLIEMQHEKASRKELVDSFSRHAKLANRYMLGVLLCSITYVANSPITDKIELPFIGKISVEYYHLILLILITCLVILFSSTNLMALRIREYYNIHFNEPNDKDFIDLTVEPTILRMAPIAWMIKNKGIFHFNILESNKTWKKIELGVYFILKFFVFIIVYFFPSIVLINIVLNSELPFNKSLTYFLISLIAISFISFGIVLKNEISYILKMPEILFKKEEK